MQRLTPLPIALRDQLVKALGGLSSATEEVAVALWSASNPNEMYDRERAVRVECSRQADVVTALVLDVKLVDDSFIAPLKATALQQAEEAGRPMKSHGERNTRVALLGGAKLPVKTLLLQPLTAAVADKKKGRGKRGKSGTGVYPGLAALGIIGLSTPALRAEVAREVTAANSVQVARASLAERGLQIGAEPALRLTYLFAGRALAAREEWLQEQDRLLAEGVPLPSGPLKGRRVVVGVDGGRLRVRIRTDKLNPKTGHMAFEAPWREPKVLTVYVVDEKGKKSNDFPVVLDGTMGDADEVFRLLTGHLRRLGAHEAAHLTLAGDGAEWIWNRADKLRLDLGLPAERFDEVVDWYHAVERLHETASRPENWSDKTSKAWVKAAKEDLRDGNVEAILDRIEQIGVDEGVTEAAKDLGYFEGHAKRMRYADFRARGTPEGSGAIESGIRRVINLRLKGNSIFWLEEHAEAMIHLRSYLKAGRWDELVRGAINQPVWTPL